jgi:diguanylate cyclase (GGDEF)-like protein
VDGAELKVTVSVGVATVRCCGARKEKAALIGIADERLYRAKEAGRNRVVGT